MATSTEAPVVTDARVTELMRRLNDATQALCWNPNGVGIGAAFLSALKAHVRIVPNASMPGGCTTACVDERAVWFSVEFLSKLDPAEAVFLLAHETCHPAMSHLSQAQNLGLVTPAPPNADGTPSGAYLAVPGKEHENRLLNVAQDVFINEHLTSSRIGRMPKGGVNLASLPGMVEPGSPAYTGGLTSEEVYFYLLKHAPKPPPGGGGGGGNGPVDATGGCAPTGLPGGLTPTKCEQLRATIRESGIGKGSSIADAFKPAPKRVDWRSILRDAFEQASVDAQDRSERSFARPSRRAVDPNVVNPGLIGTEARIACIIDVSGSVGAEWAKAAAEYVIALGDDFPEVRAWLGTHTSETCWAGWINPSTDAESIAEATAFSGGTDCTSVYDDARKAAGEADGGAFDVLIHFTDCELPSWPKPCAPRFVVGVLTGTKPNPASLPKGARVLHCTL